MKPMRNIFDISLKSQR